MSLPRSRKSQSRNRAPRADSPSEQRRQAKRFIDFALARLDAQPGEIVTGRDLPPVECELAGGSGDGFRFELPYPLPACVHLIGPSRRRQAYILAETYTLYETWAADEPAYYELTEANVLPMSCAAADAVYADDDGGRE